MFLFYLTSGMFLGWAAGANYMGNIFGTAVGTKMLSFTTSAIICSVFIIIGAVYGGNGTATSIANLGLISSMQGAFGVAVAAGISVMIMARIGIPVSSTQAIVGGILGWNLFYDMPVNLNILGQVLVSWIASPLLTALFAAILMLMVKVYLRCFPIALLYQDILVRAGLILTGAFASYSLGANNIGNIVGVFLTSSPFVDIVLCEGKYVFTAAQQLFLLGGLAIAFGVFTYSKKLIKTIGVKIFQLSPVAAWVVLMSHSLVMFLFASQDLNTFLLKYDLPAFPLVPLSSSEAIIGAVVGIALLKKGRGLRLKYLNKIAIGWLLCPFIAFVCSFAFMAIIAS